MTGMNKRACPMKIRHFTFLTGCLAAVLFLSCVRTEPEAPADVIPADEILTVTAGFEDGEAPDTRTTFSMNGAGTNVSVLWKAGDQFRMFRFVNASAANYYQTTFTTTSSGRDVEFTAAGTLSGSGNCYSAYPSSRAYAVSKYNGKPVLVMTIPSEQTAVAGGIGDGVNAAVAVSGTPTGHLTFRNILCYIRFRPTGAATAAVRKVTFEAGTSVAGAVTVFNLEDDAPRSDFSLIWPNQPSPVSSVSLSGSFVAGQDYFLALVPVGLTGFNLIFEDADGHRIRKHSTLSLSLERSKIYDFGTIDLGEAFPTEDSGETVTKYRTATLGQRPVDLCVISEGFTRTQLPTFQTLAASAIDFLFETEPYKTYKDYFNVYLLGVPSEESGASITDGNGNVQTLRDTYFGAKWGPDKNHYHDMEANDNTVFEYVSRHCPDIVAGTHAISEVPILMIINDERYGGICHSLSDGRSYSMVPYTGSGAGMQWPYTNTGGVPNGNNGPEDGVHALTESDYSDIGHSSGDWRNTAIHEFGGHGFGRLSDEYWTTLMYYTTPIPELDSSNQPVQGWTVPFGLNVTHLRDNSPWKADLLDRQAALVASDANYARIGVYQGAGEIFNKWRSEKISCMIDNRPYFSTWQRILIVKRIKSLAGETFDLNDFFDHDVTTDPVRDTPGTRSTEEDLDQLPMMPPLAPPVLKTVETIGLP